eukprot:8123516-Lingulodinium_polyedra.AAC.1
MGLLRDCHHPRRRPAAPRLHERLGRALLRFPGGWALLQQCSGAVGRFVCLGLADHWAPLRAVAHV